MATYTANIATTQTLSVDTVDTVTLTSPATRVTVTCSSAVGAGTVYFTVGSGSATTPTVGGSNAYAVVAGSSFTVDFDGSFPTVKLISSAALTYTVAAASVFNKLADNTVDNSTLQISNGVVSVKDGGIGTSKLDSTVNTYLTNSGLVYITEQSFSGVASVSLNNIFTSTYRNYRVVVEALHNSGYVSLWYRLRSGGTDNTSANYWYRSTYSDGVTYFFSGSADTKGFFMNVTTSYNVCTQDIYLPQIAQRTAFAGTYYDQNTPFVWNVGSGFATTTQFDGITLYPNTGTMTGRVAVYGYRQA